MRLGRGDDWHDWDRYRKPKPEVDKPTALVSAAYDGTAMQLDDVINGRNLPTPVPGKPVHLLVGILDRMPDEQDLHTLQMTGKVDASGAGFFITLFFQPGVIKLKSIPPPTVRGPALMKSGAQSVCTFQLMRINDHSARILSWQAEETSPAPKETDMVVLMGLIHRTLFDSPEEWQRASKPKALASTFHDLAKESGLLPLVKESCLFLPKISEDRNSARICIRLNDTPDRRAAVLATSGGSRLCVKDPTAELKPGEVTWQALPEESRNDWRQRLFTASGGKGLAISGTGSLGVRIEPGTSCSQWRVKKLPSHLNEEWLRAQLTAKGWKELFVLDIRPRGSSFNAWILS